MAMYYSNILLAIVIVPIYYFFFILFFSLITHTHCLSQINGEDGVEISDGMVKINVWWLLRSALRLMCCLWWLLRWVCIFFFFFLVGELWLYLWVVVGFLLVMVVVALVGCGGFLWLVVLYYFKRLFILFKWVIC